MLSNLTSLPSFLQAHHHFIELHFFENVLGFISVIFLFIKLYPCNYLSWECGLYKAIARHMTIIYLITSC